LVRTAPTVTILVSYKTPVAALVVGKGYIRTDKHHSVTTERHIIGWLPIKAVVTRVPQDELDALLETG
jgi:hypothetical protein